MNNLISTIYKLKNRSLISILDLNKDEIFALIKLTEILKTLNYLKAKELNYLNGKKIALIFQKPSTRTRASFVTAIEELGGKAHYYNWNELQLVRGETVKDTALVLSKYYDGAILRVYEHGILNEFSENFKKPVINALSDFEHPCQIISDFFTIYENFGRLNNIKITYIGDGNNNIANSLILGSSLLGINISIASPRKYQPSKLVYEKALEISQKTGSKILVTENIDEALENTNIIYTDVFVSMGMEKEREIRLNEFKEYQVNMKILEKAKNALFMHCGPWHIGEEVTEEVIYSKNSIVFEQAENRLYTSKAILLSLF